ncbi:MAG: hypothetical protein Q8S09_04935 [Hyphomonas sp.]|nr:hypothetical protein [Hyphomonas sp.]
MPMPPTLRSLVLWGAAYGALGFAAGFIFGALRELVLIPGLGEQTGRLVEFPMVTLAACAIGIWIGPKAAAPALGVGLIGVAVLIAFESTMALGFAGLSLADYLTHYDITRGSLFPIGLALMALAPLAGRWLKRS